MRPGAYVVARVVIARGAGRRVTRTPCTAAAVSKSAAVRTSKRESRTVESTDSSGALTITGATQANGSSPGSRYSDTAEPAAFFTGPTTFRKPARGMLSRFVSRYWVLVRLQKFGLPSAI